MGRGRGGRASAPRNTKTHTDDAVTRPPENFFQLVLQSLERVGRLKQILIMALLICGALTFAWSLIPEQGQLTVINRIFGRDCNAAGFYPSVEIDETNLIFDLTEWSPAPPGGNSAQCCKITTDEYLIARRIRNDAIYLARRAATTGQLPTFTSQTHSLLVQKSNYERIGGPRMTDFDVLLDIRGSL
jgi:hypothetical protein